MKWNPKQHPRDGENGKFTRNWEAKLAEQLDAAVQRGAMTRDYKPTTERGRNLRPLAGVNGFVRVGDRPDRQGAADGARSVTISPSTHPEAGGIWIDPNRPGSNHAPIFRNDNGHTLSDLRPVPSKSARHKGDLQDGRRVDMGANPTGDERLAPEDGGKRGRRWEGAPEAAIKELRRAQARARVEGSARTPRRRTPRGTQVDSWMSKVNEQYEKGTRRG